MTDKLILTTKICSKCKVLKLVTSFSKNRSTKSGLQCWCKSCKAVCQKDYQQTIGGKEVYRKGKVVFRDTLYGYLYHRWEALILRCGELSKKCYKNVQCLFKDFDEFFHHITIDLCMDSIEKLKGLEIHRINNGNYAPGKIEFLTPAEHGFKHKQLNTF